jgi:hypothetical protein
LRLDALDIDGMKTTLNRYGALAYRNEYTIPHAYVTGLK